MIIVFTSIALILGVLFLGYMGLPILGWTLGILAVLLWMPVSWGWLIAVAVLGAIANIPVLRQRLLSKPIMNLIQRFHWLPKISDTERAAIEAGTVWVEEEFFTGVPDTQRLLSVPYPHIPDEVQAFLDGPVTQVCRMTSDWEIYQRKDLPPEVWSYLKQEKFFGMMIPKEYGGLGFTPVAYSAVMAKLASRSFTHVATVGVTNSLGPAKLLLRYGTETQKQRYLPRLASGEDIPCFALTEPLAGSDAASITSHGVVFQDDHGDLCIRLNWKKRYITLGAIATLIGLTFQLKDPDHLIGDKEDVGITCALVPSHLEGVIQNRRHDPMGVPFYNSPLEGHDVVIPIENIIGGVKGAGQGWKMIMQSLAAGRGISFPASCSGIAKLVSRVATAHAQVRQQFGLSISRFGGVEEPLARIAGYSYLVDAIRLYTLAAVEQGEQPAVAAAIAKYHTTELTRKIVMDGMDILGGAGICRGPHNLLANVYTAMPIAITVEGANILTRSLMIFGQGSIRCHPYVYDEILALEQGDLPEFDEALWGHIGQIWQQFCRVKLLTLTQGHLIRSAEAKEIRPYIRKLQWASSWFAFMSNTVMIMMGGQLKRQEKITGRFADIMSWLYLGSATLWKFESEGAHPADLPTIHWVMETVFSEIQTAFIDLNRNIPCPWILKPFMGAIALSLKTAPLGHKPSDELGHAVVKSLLTNNAVRDRLTQGIYLTEHPDEAIGRLEEAFGLIQQTLPLTKRLKAAIRAGTLPKAPLIELLESALAAQLLTPEESKILKTSEAARTQAVQVDSFSLSEYLRGHQFGSTRNQIDRDHFQHI